MSTTATAPAAVGLADKAGRYLTFTLGRESYGLPVLKVREIIRMTDITPVPRMPAYVKGVINLRGKVIPVIDLRLRFDLPSAEFDERTCTIIVQVNSASGGRNLMGLIVDAVEEVSQIGEQNLEPTPDFGSSLTTDYIIAMARVKGGVKTLLDIDLILAADRNIKLELPTNSAASS
ncbi:MAG TPA: chemotaxis protein CheW [Verrucomicrobiales bacterium]|nr:chemotaxis protein CheW [Verrucomicrobiales bacterium]